MNIGPRIGIDGEKEYRKQINELITQQKTFSAQMKELESSFDDSTSAMEKNRKKSELLEKQIANQEKQVEELEKGLEASAKKYGENSVETNKWKQAVANGKTELNKMKQALNDIPKPMQQVGKSMQEVGKKISSVGDSLTKYVTTPIVALGALSIASFNEVDKGLDIVTKKTGATGEALDDLHESVKNVAGEIPTDFETAGEAIGEVNTRFGLTGKELETLSGKFIKFADLNNTDVSSSIDGVQKVMSAFGMETEEAGDLLDAMNRAGQNTGISMDTLQSSMIKNSAALQDMGLNAYDAAAFLGQVETSGANTDTVMTGLSKALTNAAKDGKTLPQALSEFQSVMNSTASDQEKLTAATELFGKKAGPAIFEACKQGSLSFENLSSDASEYLGSVETTFENTLDGPDKMKVALNNLKTVGSELGATLLEIAAPAIEKITDLAKEARDFFNNLTDAQKTTASEIAIAFAIGGPALKAIGNLVSMIGSVVEKFGAIPGAAAKIASIALPVGAAIASLVLLKAGIDAAHDEAIDSVDGLRETLSNTASATKDLNSASRDLKKVFEETRGNIDDINEKSAAASAMVDELYDLDAVTNKTVGQQQKMKSIVASLNELYPGLSLAIDETTGSLTKGKTEVKNYIEQARKIALLEAYATGAKTAYTKLADAHLALYNAQQQQKDAQDAYYKAYHQWYELQANAPKELMAGTEAQAAWNDEVNQAWDASETARKSLEKLNGAVNDAEVAISDCEEECEFYTEQQEELSSATEETTKATKDGAEAADDAAEAYKTEAAEVDNSASAMSKRAAQLAKDITESVAKIGEEIKAWDDLYETTKTSIEGQLKLFEAWDKSTDMTAQDMLANLRSQTQGMSNYAQNMETLSKAAVESSDPNFKAFVQSLADMGIDGAAEVDVLVRTMENDKDTFNSIVAEFGSNRKTAISQVAEIETYIKSGFATRTQIALKGIITTINDLGKTPGFQQMKVSAQTALLDVGEKVKSYVATTKQAGEDVKANFANGYSTLPFTAAQASQQAKASTESTINGMKLEPKVNSINVPGSVTSAAKSTITEGVSDIHGKVTQVNGAASAARSAAREASDGLTVSAKMEITNTSSAALDAANKIRNWFASNPITTFVKAVTSAAQHAEGGIVERETLSWLAEGNKPEAVIPLATSQRANALSLYEQTGEILGVKKASSVEPATITLPGEAAREAVNGSFSLDLDQMYSAVASAAKRGMENANIRIYWDNREAGRIMKNMGVQFV